MISLMYYLTKSDYLLPHRLLPQPLPREMDIHFSGQDSRESFVRNIKKQPIDWKYRTKKVTYSLNKQFYRAPEWNTIDWKNSVVVLGCSNVFGIGLSEDETISYQLEKILARPVINLGAGGTGMSFAMNNSVLLNKNFPTPWAVITIWSDPNRIHEFITGSEIKHYTAKTHANSFSRAWGDSEINPEMYSYFACKSTEAIWSHKTKYLSYSHWAPLTGEAISSLPFIEGDLARDMMHPGSEMAHAAAKTLAEKLK